MTAIGSRRRRRRILLNPHSICKFTFVFLLFIIISVIRTPFYLLLFASIGVRLFVCIVAYDYFVLLTADFFSSPLVKELDLRAPHPYYIHCINKRLLKSAGNGKIVENWLLRRNTWHMTLKLATTSNRICVCARYAQTHAHPIFTVILDISKLVVQMCFAIIRRRVCVRFIFIE